MARPKKKIDYELVGKLAAIQCTHEEIALILDISRQTLVKDEKFLYIYNTKKEEGRASLRRRQWQAADSGNVTMLIWLGKQYLGQRDESAMLVAGAVGVTIVDDIPGATVDENKD